MKVIDLLNKIAKGEEIPKKINYLYSEYEYNDKLKCYENPNEFFPSIQEVNLNDEVEIIEEEQETGEIEILTFDNMKDFGIKAGKAYRNLFEGFNKGWNMPIEEKKEIEKINYYPIRKNEIAVDYIENNETKHFCLNKKEKYFVDKINELVRELNELKNK